MAAKAAEKAGDAGEDKIEYISPVSGEVSLVTTDEAKALALRDEAAMYAEDSGAGFENQTDDDIAVPFIIVAQPGSPEVQGEDAVAKSGMFLNRTTGEVYSGKEGFDFIPATTEHKMVEWLPKNADGSGGGFVGIHEIDSELSKHVRSTQPLGKYKHPENGNDLIETFYAYGLVVDRETQQFYAAIIPFASTFIKPYQGWMFKARSIMLDVPDGRGGRRKVKAPLFAHVYTFRTERQLKGTNTWYIPAITYAGARAEDCRLSPMNDLYQAAKAMKEAVQTNALKMDTTNLTRDGGTGDAPPVKGDTGAEDAPY